MVAIIIIYNQKAVMKCWMLLNLIPCIEVAEQGSIAGKVTDVYKRSGLYPPLQRIYIHY